MKIEFTIENKTYELPEFINIEQFVKIYKLKNVLSDEYFSVKLLNILTDCPIEDLLQVNYQQVDYLTAYAMTLFPKENEKFIDRFTLDGVEYGFLDSWKKFSFGEWVDLDTLISKKTDEVIDNIHIILAIMYRPIVKEDKKTKKYQIEKYDSDKMQERAELFKTKLNIKVYFGTLVFFSLFAKKYTSPTQPYLNNLSLWKKIRLIWRYRKIIGIVLQEDGDGMSSSTELVPMILHATMKSYKKPWWKFSIKQRFLSRKTKKQLNK